MSDDHIKLRTSLKEIDVDIGDIANAIMEGVDANDVPDLPTSRPGVPLSDTLAEDPGEMLPDWIRKAYERYKARAWQEEPIVYQDKDNMGMPENWRDLLTEYRKTRDAMIDAVNRMGDAIVRADADAVAQSIRTMGWATRHLGDHEQGAW